MPMPSHILTRTSVLPGFSSTRRWALYVMAFGGGVGLLILEIVWLVAATRP
jgi:hypothetical protein